MNIVITGGEKGLGQAIIKELKPDDVLNIKGRDIRKANKKGILKVFIDEQINALPFIPDIVINNYGINHLSWIGKTPIEDGDIININVMCPYWLINSIVERGHPCKIINIASQTHRVAMRTTTLYCASKAAVVMMTKTMARELAPLGYVVNCFAPGKILDTDMARMTDEQVCKLRDWSHKDAEKYAIQLIPMSRFTNLDECAKVVKSIVEMPAYVNGTVIEATGGL